MLSHPNTGSLIIVAREQRALWHALVQEFQDVDYIHIVLDRRSGERRAPWGPVAYDRRRQERRNLPRMEDELRVRRYLLVHQPTGRGTENSRSRCRHSSA